MSKLEVNFIPNQENQESRAPDRENRLPRPLRRIKASRSKSRRWKIIIVSLIIIIIISGLIFFSSVLFGQESLVNNLSKFNIFHQVRRLITSDSKKLYGENQDRVNFLIIGEGGKNHEGGTLADTIILASLKPSTNRAAMMSIPRDTQYCETGGGCYKINAISAFAEQKKAGAGGQVMAQKLSALLGLDIHYYVVVDFDGFEKIIDEFGGVNINVENDLIDYEYPIRGKENVYPIENRYEKLVIKAGEQHLDGELALKYARSRHAQGTEGSDFTRSKRQQKIITALKEKVFTVDTFVNPKKINSLLSAYNEHIQTNLKIWEMLRLLDLSKNIDTAAIIHYSLTDGANPLLYSAMINGSYLLLPTTENFDDISKVWQYIFYKNVIDDVSTTKRQIPKPAVINSTSTEQNNDQASTTPSKPVNQLPIVTTAFKNEAAKIEIRNGTWITGYATKEKTRLEALGLKISGTGNADNHEYAKNVIYDLSGGQYPATAQELKKLYDLEISPVTAGIGSTADFLIILGGQ